MSAQPFQTGDRLAAGLRNLSRVRLDQTAATAMAFPRQVKKPTSAKPSINIIQVHGSETVLSELP